MAFEFYVTVEGSKQGRLKGESVREAHRDKLVGVAFHYEVKTPRDAASGQATGKRQHGPVTFTKVWGAATPQLFQALVTNEVLKSVLFEFVRTSAEGIEEVFHTVRLTNATVSEIEQHVAFEPEGDDGLPELEDVSFTFQKIAIENKPGRTMAEDDVSGRR